MAESLAEKKILLLGGNGFLGGHLARSLAGGWQVRVFDRPQQSRQHGVGDFVAGDIGNSSDLDEALTGCDTVVYLVHDSGASPLLDSDRLSLVRNLELLMLAVEATVRQGVNNFVFVSSGGAVYGVPQSAPVAEDHPLCPISGYGAAKAAMEMYLNVAVHKHGIRTLILRPSNPYGPGQNPQRKQGVVPIFAHRILSGLPIEIWGDGNGAKDYLLVNDLTDCMAALVQAGCDHQAYNIASGQSATLVEIIKVIELATGKQAEVVFKEQRAGDVSAITLDNRKMLERIGQRQFVSLEQGVAQTVEWLMASDR